MKDLITATLFKVFDSIIISAFVELHLETDWRFFADKSQGIAFITWFRSESESVYCSKKAGITWMTQVAGKHFVTRVCWFIMSREYNKCQHSVLLMISLLASAKVGSMHLFSQIQLHLVLHFLVVNHKTFSHISCGNYLIIL